MSRDDKQLSEVRATLDNVSIMLNETEHDLLHAQYEHSEEKDMLLRKIDYEIRLDKEIHILTNQLKQLQEAENESENRIQISKDEMKHLEILSEKEDGRSDHITDQDIEQEKTQRQECERITETCNLLSCELNDVERQRKREKQDLENITRLISQCQSETDNNKKDLEYQQYIIKTSKKQMCDEITKLEVIASKYEVLDDNDDICDEAAVVEIQTLVAEVEQIQADMDEIEQELKSKKQKLKTTSTEVREIHQKLETRIRELVSIETTKKDLQRHIEEVKQKLSGEKLKLNKTKNVIKKSWKLNEKKSRNVTNIKEEIEEMKWELHNIMNNAQVIKMKREKIEREIKMTITILKEERIRIIETAKMLKENDKHKNQVMRWRKKVKKCRNNVKEAEDDGRKYECENKIKMEKIAKHINDFFLMMEEVKQMSRGKGQLKQQLNVCHSKLDDEEKKGKDMRADIELSEDMLINLLCEDTVKCALEEVEAELFKVSDVCTKQREVIKWMEERETLLLEKDKLNELLMDGHKWA